MPPKKRKSQQQRGDMPEMIQFKLTDDEMTAFEQWLAKNAARWDTMVMDAMLNDHKVGVSWDAYNDCFIASFTAKGEDHINIGKCLLSRSTDWREAVAINLYKVHIFTEEYSGVWENRNADNQRG